MSTREADIETLTVICACTVEQAAQALDRHAGNMDRAADAILSGSMDLPPLAPTSPTWETSSNVAAPRNSPDLLPDPREAPQAGWSSSTGSWATAQSTRTAGPVVLRDQDDMARAVEESLMSHSHHLEHSAAAERIFEDHLSPMDQVRPLEEGAPVLLRSSSAVTSWLPLFLQGLYALPAVRNAIISLPLEHTSLEPGLRYTYNGFWNGQRTHPHFTSSLHDTPESYLELLRAIQRLFVFMTYTRRRVVNVQDVSNAFGIRPMSDPSSLPPQKYVGELSRPARRIA